ncbi:hypothetical protein K432DRAFT_396019 [Lepidopterella palustris CBS 459.81]|uniref:Gfd2/YDR514C-like C-terminal domain-containing protein n=1 Tax=Lepidopterella palustris CBS 459.81 TaxID=1314670 RepID=A0A8E2E4B5_9PEZI|nr:hypothetical protein K432DRAFT_396019 [Lepidopterella palustris CBS 459.81]
MINCIALEMRTSATPSQARIFENWLKKIRLYHLCICVVGHMVNKRFYPGNLETFDFGNTALVSRDGIKKILNNVFHVPVDTIDPSMDTPMRPIVFLSHARQSGISGLRCHLDLDIGNLEEKQG